MIKLTLPSPPSLNELYGRNRFGGVHKKKAHRDFMATVQKIITEKKIKPFKKPVRLEISWYRPSKRGDLDNIMKTLFDALEVPVVKVKRKVVDIGKYGLYHNDSQVDQLLACKNDDKKNPRVEIVAYEI